MKVIHILLIGLLLIPINAVVCFAPLEYTCEYWSSFFKEKPVDVSAWKCLGASFIPPIGWVGLVGGGVTFVVSEFVENPHYVSN